MNDAIRVIVAVVTIATVPAFADAGPEAADLAAAVAAVDELVALHMTEHRTPGVALAVTSPEGLLHEAGFGLADLGSRAPVTLETLFQIGSVTKSFTAVLLLQLAEEGAVAIHRPVDEALPWFAIRNDYGHVTPHHLLTHTAGIPENRDDLPPSPFITLALSEQAVAWPPGDRFHYSNVGFQILQAVVETASGAGWAELVRTRVLEPLGMTNTEPVIVPGMRSRQAQGHVDALSDRPAHRSRPLVVAPFVEYTAGDGCMASTPRDMAAYLRMLLNRGAGPAGRILSADAFEAMSTPWITPWKRTGYGYGIAVRRDGDLLQLMHSGSTIGFSSTVIADLGSGLGVVVLLNGPGDAQNLATSVLAVFRNVLAGEPLPAPQEPPDPLRVDAAADYAGTFTAADGGVWTFEVSGAYLTLVADGRSVALEPRGVDAFYTPDTAFDRYLFRFGRDDDGRVVEVTHGPRWLGNPHHDGPAEPSVPLGWSAYAGRYTSYSPWFHDFTVFVRHGGLWAVTGAGGEADGGDELRLLPLGGGVFSVGDQPTPEILRFAMAVEGRTWRADWSGHPFYRDRIR